MTHFKKTDGSPQTKTLYEEIRDGMIAAAFTEWMRRYTEDPAAFEAEFNVVAAFREDGGPEDYGRRQAAYLRYLIDELYGEPADNALLKVKRGV